MKWTAQEEQQIKYFYTKTDLALEKIAREMGRSVPSVHGRLAKLRIKRRNLSTVKLPSKITPALARIHSHICGDGYVYSYQTKDIYGPWAKYRKNPIRTRYFVGYTNYNIDLLKEFQKDVYETFGIKGQKIYKNDVKASSKKIWEFMKKMGAGDSYNWRIPKEISKSSKEVMKNWIRAFFDDEAYFDKNKKGEVIRIRVKCVNKKGLTQLMKMLKEFVPCNLMPKKGFYWGHTVCLNVNRKNTPEFFSKIGSIRYHA